MTEPVTETTSQQLSLNEQLTAWLKERNATIGIVVQMPMGEHVDPRNFVNVPGAQVVWGVVPVKQP